MNQAVAGIDVGSQSTKVVILEADRILAAVTVTTGDSGESDAREALAEALRQAGLRLEDMKSVMSTGVGRASVPFAAKQRSIVGCLAKGAHFLYPQVRTVLDAGAESCTAIRVSVDGAAVDSASNHKCAAGAGVFLDTISEMLRIPVAQLGAESLKATSVETIASQCAVFAESEVVSLVHRDPPVPVANILAGIHESLVGRLFALAQRVGMQPDVVMCGGVARNIGIIRAMEAKLGKPVFVPELPQILGALGAALVAQQGLA
ncbi:MAG: acyl-CoA dehydratase activase [Bacteroidales bacterium]